MVYFQRVILAYIFMPLFLVILSSCDNSVEDKGPPAAQEAVTVKIAPLEKKSAQAQSESQDKVAIGTAPALVSEEKVVSTSETGVSPQQELTFKVEAKSPKDAVSQSVPDSKPPIALELKNGTGSTADISPKTEVAPNDIISDLTPIAGAPPPVSESQPPADQSPEKLTGVVETRALLPAGEVTGQISEEKLFYIPKGKVDPFEPLLKEKAPVVETQEKVEEDIPKRVLTPLEKLDFGQMKLVAILSRASGSVAMVQESTGKGYIVNIGTYIGRNSGQVISIEKDKLIIQEKVKDYKGNFVDHFQELKLNKLDDKG